MPGDSAMHCRICDVVSVMSFRSGHCWPENGSNLNMQIVPLLQFHPPDQLGGEGHGVDLPAGVVEREDKIGGIFVHVRMYAV
jgi:hypothetical protein